MHGLLGAAGGRVVHGAVRVYRRGGRVGGVPDPTFRRPDHLSFRQFAQACQLRTRCSGTINRPCAQQFVGKSQSCMVNCAHAAQGLLYPFIWQVNMRHARTHSVGKSQSCMFLTVPLHLAACLRPHPAGHVARVCDGTDAVLRRDSQLAP